MEQRRFGDVTVDALLDGTGSFFDDLAVSGRLQLLDGHGVLATGIEAVPTPGHTPGHQSILVTGGDIELVLTGDVLVHAVQLADPTVAYKYESDPDQARETRVELLAARQRGAVLATPHLREAFIALDH